MPQTKLKFLVTGGAGFIGSHLVDALLALDFQVVVLDDFSTGSWDNLKHFEEDTGEDDETAGIKAGPSSNVNCKVIKASINDLGSGELHSDLAGLDGIFHMAALARVQPSIQDPTRANFVNEHGSLKVFDYARKLDIPVVFSSSSSIYGDQGEDMPESEYAESDPMSPYALQKLQCEQNLELFAGLYGLRSIALRYFNVYGERQLVDGAYATVIGIFLDQYKKDVPFTVVGDGTQRRDFTYVKDVVMANIQSMMKLIRPSVSSGPKGTFKIYNVGTGKNYSVNEIADLIDPLHPKTTAPARIEPWQTQADNSLIQADLGWKPGTNFEDWLHTQALSIRKSREDEASQPK